MLRYAIVVAIGAALSWAASAAAQSDMKSAANTLFEEGRTLVAAGEVDQACQKFEASLQLLDQLGVRLNYADCLERQGKTAAAWTEFRESAERAKRRGDDARATFAAERVKALEPQLVKLQIVVAQESRVPGLIVRRDGVEIPSAAFGSSLPINPASYTIEASAKGYKPWKTNINAQEPGKVVAVEVPQLEAEDNEDVVLGSADEPALRRRRLFAIGVGSAGVVTFAAGLGLRAETGAFRDTGTVLAGAGLAVMITGMFLYLTTPDARPALSNAYLDIRPSDDSTRSTSVSVGVRSRF